MASGAGRFRQRDGGEKATKLILRRNLAKLHNADPARFHPSGEIDNTAQDIARLRQPALSRNRNDPDLMQQIARISRGEHAVLSQIVSCQSKHPFANWSGQFMIASAA
ncbi:MAG: hypothetical protein ACR2OV_15705 [Hyphomicrobiaceae bacterium]